MPAAPRRCPEPCSSLSLNSEPVACALLKLMLLPVPRLPGARRPWGTPLLPTDAIPSSDESVMSTSGVATAGLRDGSAAPARLDERRCIAQPGERAPLISVEHAPALGPQRHRGACGAPQPPTRGHRARRLPLLQADCDQTDHGRRLTGEACRSARRPRADIIPWISQTRRREIMHFLSTSQGRKLEKRGRRGGRRERESERWQAWVRSHQVIDRPTIARIRDSRPHAP